MGQALRKQERIAQNHAFKRRAVLDAARRVVARDGADGFTIRAVAAEAGYTPGAVYSYFDTRDELALELLGQDLSQLAKDLKSTGDTKTLLLTAITALQNKDAFAPYTPALMDTQSNRPDSDSGRLVTGRLIQCLKVLSESMRNTADDSTSTDKDTLILAAMCVGLAALQKSERLDLLGYSQEDLVDHMLARLLP